MSLRTRQRRQRLENRSPSRERWLLSYADFITLLLALFVVLYASARVDAETNHSIIEGMRFAFVSDEISPTPSKLEIPRSMKRALDEPRRPTGEAGSELRLALEQALEQQRSLQGAELGARLHEDERGIVISLAASEFFPAGGVEISEERRAVLATLAPLLASTLLPLRFEGHTDDEAPTDDRYPSNWELSSARAAAVARLFIEDHGIDPQRVATSGYAEYRPLVGNLGAAERAQNRRVEIVVLRGPAGAAAIRSVAGEVELEQLLEGLPPIPSEVDESLRPRDLGPPPENIPLP